MYVSLKIPKLEEKKRFTIEIVFLVSFGQNRNAFCFTGIGLHRILDLRSGRFLSSLFLSV